MALTETSLQARNGLNESVTPNREIGVAGSGAFDITNVADAIKVSDLLATSGLFGVTRKEQAFVILALGAELGLKPVAALNGIYVVNNRPTLASDTMLALCRQRPDVCRYFRLIESTDTHATYETERVGQGGPTRHTYTMDDAVKAKLTGKDNWQKHPKAMLRARCVAELCRIEYSDIIKGMYVPDEVDDLPPAAEVRVHSVETPATRTDQVKARLAPPKPGPAVSSTPISEVPEEDRTPDDHPVRAIDAEPAIDREALIAQAVKDFACLPAGRQREIAVEILKTYKVKDPARMSDAQLVDYAGSLAAEVAALFAEDDEPAPARGGGTGVFCIDCEERGARKELSPERLAEIEANGLPDICSTCDGARADAARQGAMFEDVPTTASAPDAFSDAPRGRGRR